MQQAGERAKPQLDSVTVVDPRVYTATDILRESGKEGGLHRAPITQVNGAGWQGQAELFAIGSVLKTKAIGEGAVRKNRRMKV